MEYTRRDAKAWAWQNLKGLFSGCTPCFKPDTMDLDEAGTRHDINHLIRMGVGGLYFAGTVTMTPAAWERFMRIAVDEARGRVVTVVVLHPDTMSEFFRQAEFAQSIGADLLNVMTPPVFRPSSEQDVYDVHKRLADAVDIGITLFPNPKAGYLMSPQLIAALAEVDTIVGTKNSPFDNTHNLETFRLCGDKIVIGIPGTQDWAVFVEHGLQMAMGTPHARMLQTPEKPWLQEYWDGLMARDWERAWTCYQRVKPLLDLFWRIFGVYFQQVGTYPQGHYKYWEGLLGMTGGPQPQPQPTLRRQDKDQIRNGLIAAGLIDERQAAAAEQRMVLAAA